LHRTRRSRPVDEVSLRELPRLRSRPVTLGSLRVQVLSRRPLPLLTVIALTMIGAALRFASLDLQSFWSDEAMTSVIVRMHFGGMLSAVRHSESTPPVYYVLAWLWARMFGAGEVGLRSFSALAGTATIPVVYAAASTLVSRRAGIAAAAIVATHPLLVWYSQEARSYALLVLLSALAFLFFARATESRSRRSVALWSLFAILAMATHYFALFIVAPTAVWLLVIRRDTAARIAVAATAAGGAALLPLAVPQSHNAAAAWIEDISLRSRIVNLAKQFLVGQEAPHDQAAAAAVAAVLVVGLATLAVRRRPLGRGGLIAVAVGTAALVVPVAFTVVGPDYVITKNMIAALIPLIIAAAAVLDRDVSQTKNRFPRLAVVSVGAICAVYVAMIVMVDRNAAYQRGDWRGAAAAATDTGERRVIVVAPDFGGWFARIPLLVYLPQARSIDRRYVQPLVGFRRALRWNEATAPRTVATQEIVQITMGNSQPYALIAHLPQGFRRVETRSAPGYAIVRYRSDRRVDVAPATLVVRTAGTIPAAVLLSR
jgi:mannosyltransferase